MATIREQVVKSIFGADVSKRLFGVGKPTDLNFSMNRFTTNQIEANYLAQYTRLVYACISAIAEDVGDYEAIFYRQKGDNLDQITAHPMLQLLQNPQPQDDDGVTMYDLFEATQSFIELQGECFWYLPYGEFTKRPKEIHIIRPDKMGISIDDQGEVDGYFMRTAPGQDPVPFETFEILHFKSFNPHDPYRGMGTVQAAMDYIQTEGNMTGYTKNFFANNAGLSGVLTIKGEVSKNAFRKFSNAWREKYQGVDNAGKIAIVRDSDSTFTKVGLGLNELDMKDLKDGTIDDVTMMFRVPKALLGLSNSTGLGRAEVEALEYIFSKTIDKKYARIDGVIQRAINRYFPADGIIVSHVNKIPANQTDVLAERTAGVDKWITRNEIRDQEGLDGQAGGDVLYGALSSIPLGESGIESTSSTTSTGKDMQGIHFARAKNGRILMMRTKKKSLKQPTSIPTKAMTK